MNGMFQALCPDSRSILASIYMNIEVWQDWLDFLAVIDKRGYGDFMSFAEWCGVEPYRADTGIIWC
jgi:hypothetical protein